MRLGMWMTSCPEAIGRDFLVILKKKQLVEIWSWSNRVDFSDLGEASAICGLWARARVGQVNELRADDGRTVSIEKIVFLSLIVSKNLNLKKVIKVSYLNQESRQGFAYFGIPTHVNVFPYHGYITRQLVIFFFRYFGMASFILII